MLECILEGLTNGAGVLFLAHWTFITAHHTKLSHPISYTDLRRSPCSLQPSLRPHTRPHGHAHSPVFAMRSHIQVGVAELNWVDALFVVEVDIFPPAHAEV